MAFFVCDDSDDKFVSVDHRFTAEPVAHDGVQVGLIVRDQDSDKHKLVGNLGDARRWATAIETGRGR